MTTVGILGGGQLGRMLALAGYPLGLSFRFFDDAEAAPVAPLAELVRAPYGEASALDRFAHELDVATLELENVPLEAAARVAQTTPLYPGPRALSVAQDRLAEKSLFRDLGIPTVPFAAVDSQADLESAVGSIGLPAILKTRRFGYDGKGQRVLRAGEDVSGAWQELGGVPCTLEGFLRFDRELSLIGVRARDGRTAFYPLVQNEHRDGILRLSIAPAPDVSPRLRIRAQQAAEAILDRLEYVGVLAIEWFQVDDDLLANEMAPRVHNSGHWSIEGAAVSQFENHLRAVLGWPLGGTEAKGVSAMLNLVGTTPAQPDALAIPGTHLHLYGKAPRAGRKLGHVTLCASDHAALALALPRLLSLAP